MHHALNRRRLRPAEPCAIPRDRPACGVGSLPQPAGFELDLLHMAVRVQRAAAAAALIHRQAQSIAPAAPEEIAS